MLISIYLPFFDYRHLMVGGFNRLSKPAWPFPDHLGGHLRSIGAIRQRRKRGFEGWVGEDRLAFRVNALTVQLPRQDVQNGLGRLRLIRKACFFDGLTNGRVELLFTIEPAIGDREIAFRAASKFVSLKAKIAKSDFEGTLGSAGPAVGQLWANVSVKHGEKNHSDWVRGGRAVCFVESDSSLARNDEEDLGNIEPNVELAFISRAKPMELLLISQNLPQTLSVVRGSHYRSSARFIRAYTLRLLQNVESLSLLFSLPLSSINNDAVQNLVNEYTRQINRSRLRIEGFKMPEVIDYCYSAFGRLYPGRIDGLRAQIQSSKIRPAVARKLLQFLDLSEASRVNIDNLSLGDDIHGDKIEGDYVMGDKYGNINVTGSQGTAIGREAIANVSGSTNNANLTSSLESLANEIRKQADKPDAEVEATLVEAAAKKAQKGDETGAAAILKKSASWVLDLAKSAGSAALSAFLKSHLGIG
jgi:hypothetical protein